VAPAKSHKANISKKLSQGYVEVLQGYHDLRALGVTDEWIWGNGAATVVYAQAYGRGRTLTFRFSLSSDNPVSIPSRIINFYHVRTVPSSASFETRSDMRSALWSLVAKT